MASEALKQLVRLSKIRRAIDQDKSKYGTRVCNQCGYPCKVRSSYCKPCLDILNYNVRVSVEKKIRMESVK